MAALLVVLMFVGFAIVDAVVRSTSRRLSVAREARERESLLERVLAQSRGPGGATLRRVELPSPDGRVLVAGAEAGFLDGLRRALVLTGYSVDTVERCEEALSLAKARDYDLVVPGSGLDRPGATELARRLARELPALSVAVATTGDPAPGEESLARLRWPSPPEELRGELRRLAEDRDARLAAARPPEVVLGAPEQAETEAPHVISLPGGVFLSAGHVWVALEADGGTRLGLDDLARKALGKLETVVLPAVGSRVRRDEVLFTVCRAEARVRFLSPLDGQVIAANPALGRAAAAVARSPYRAGWICRIQPDEPGRDLATLKVGAAAAEFLRKEAERLHGMGGHSAAVWADFEREFLASRTAGRS